MAELVDATDLTQFYKVDVFPQSAEGLCHCLLCPVRYFVNVVNNQRTGAAPWLYLASLSQHALSLLSAAVSTLLLVKPIDISSLNGCAPMVQNRELCIEDASALIKQHPRRADLSCTMSTYVECYQQS